LRRPQRQTASGCLAFAARHRCSISDWIFETY
jgi:hypothetical protein